jgi:hypothetical protein
MKSGLLSPYRCGGILLHASLRSKVVSAWRRLVLR